MTFYDFVVEKDHLFLRNIYNENDFKNSHAIKHIETYYKILKKFIECSLLIKKYYNRDSETDNVENDCIETFNGNNLNSEYETFAELYDEKIKLQTKNSGYFKKRSDSKLQLKK